MTGAEVTSLIEAITSPWTLLLAVAVFGFVPVFTVRLAVKLYPAGHPRRAELVAELLALPRMTRVFFASEVLAHAIVEGLGERRKVARARPEKHKKLRRAARKAYFQVCVPIVAACAITGGVILAAFRDQLPDQAGGMVSIFSATVAVAAVSAPLLRRRVRRLRAARRRLATYRLKHAGGTG